ncbi:MAG: MAPEG family protein [Myxococcota bacterium]
MTVPFVCLLIVVLLPYALSTLGGYFRVRQLGTLDNKYPRIQATELEGIGARAWAAQANAWEAVAVFTAAVLVAHVAGADPEKSATAAIAFVVLRVAHAACYLANLDVLRSIVFLGSLAAAVRLFLLAGSA